MSQPSLQTKSLKLLLQTPEAVRESIAAMSPSDRSQVSADWVARVAHLTEPDPWTHGFAILHRESNSIIGSCGFKGPPTPEGVVEIAYGLDPAHQGKGYATEAAVALLEFAFESDRVRVVCAHTLPAVNASGRVLTKCGFRRIGEVIDPEDGLVWRWERSKKPG